MSEQAIDLTAYRGDVRAWLAEHAPPFSGDFRHALSFEEDVALGRRWQALKAQHGYSAITLPKRFGGGGGTELHKIIFTEEELRYHLPTEYFTISLSHVVAIVLRHCQLEQAKDQIGSAACRGDDIWCQMFSEPAAGSDLGAVRLKAEREGDGWRLNGQKLWTSWAQIAEWGFVVTRTDPTALKHAGLTAFYLNMKTPGLRIRPIRRMAGHADVNEVFFDDVYIPDTQRLGAAGKGFNVAVEMLMIERYGGVEDECLAGTTLESVIELAHRSRLNGRPAIEDGEVRSLLADALIERQGLRSIHRRALQAIAAGKEPGPEGAIRKLLLGRQRQRIGRLALDLLGAEGVYMNPQGSTRTDFAWSWIDPAGRIAGGTDEILMSTLAERILGLPQDYRPDKGIPFNQLT
jgi:alkylation response protein AidB-like acyl-CoA dehydrogenase